MNILAIDIGNYSVKFTKAYVHKKQLHAESLQEVVIDQYAEQIESQLDRKQIVQEIIADFLDNQESQYKIVTQVSNKFVSSRLFKIPIKNKKKAELTLPFQLEENIPFALNQVHYTYFSNQVGNSTHSHVFYTQKEKFEETLEGLKEVGCLPQVVTAESSGYLSYVKNKKLDEPIIVLDIGHETTKAHVFYKQELISTHLSYIAGKTVNEMIAKTYNISDEEAIIYKHQNSFFLTADQFEQVNDQQKDFAQYMDKVFSALIADIKRWEIGFRVKHGEPIKNILITGGSANIKNIKNYLTEATHIETRRLKSFHELNTSQIGDDKKVENKFSTSVLMGMNMLHKNQLINFRTGIYATESNDDIPLHSASYIGWRVVATSLLIVIAIMAEFWSLNQDTKKINRRITKVIKVPSLNIPIKEQKRFKRKPNERNTKKILSKLKKQKKQITQEIKIIQSAAKINGTNSLVQLSNSITKSPEVHLIEFSQNNGDVKAVFKSEDLAKLKQVKAQIQDLDLDNKKFDLNQSSKKLSVFFTEL